VADDFDMTEFIERLRVLDAHVAGAARRGLIDAAEQVLGASQERCPVKTGRLTGSATLDDARADAGQVTFGHNTDYAAAVHERRDVHHAQGEAGFLAGALATELPRVNRALGERIEREGLRD